MSLIELPFCFPGRIFRSPMPFGPYDLHGEVYDRFCEEQIGVIVLLASDEECLHKTGCNLRALYLKEGFQVLYLPIPDFGVPTKVPTQAIELHKYYRGDRRSFAMSLIISAAQDGQILWLVSP